MNRGECQKEETKKRQNGSQDAQNDQRRPKVKNLFPLHDGGDGWGSQAIERKQGFTF